MGSYKTSGAWMIGRRMSARELQARGTAKAFKYGRRLARFQRMAADWGATGGIVDGKFSAECPEEL